MFYSAHDDALPFQLVGIGLIKSKTKQPRSKLAAKLCWKLSWMCRGFTQVLQLLFAFFSSSDTLSKVETEVLTIPCSSSAMNNTATKSKRVYLSPLREICLGQGGGGYCPDSTFSTFHSCIQNQ